MKIIKDRPKSSSRQSPPFGDVKPSLENSRKTGARPRKLFPPKGSPNKKTGVGSGIERTQTPPGLDAPWAIFWANREFGIILFFKCANSGSEPLSSRQAGSVAPIAVVNGLGCGLTRRDQRAEAWRVAQVVAPRFSPFHIFPRSSPAGVAGLEVWDQGDFNWSQGRRHPLLHPPPRSRRETPPRAAGTESRGASIEPELHGRVPSGSRSANPTHSFFAL